MGILYSPQFRSHEETKIFLRTDYLLVELNYWYLQYHAKQESPLSSDNNWSWDTIETYIFVICKQLAFQWYNIVRVFNENQGYDSCALINLAQELCF